MDNVEKAEGFMTFVGDNLEKLKETNKRYADSKLGGFDEDVFYDTILKIYDKILKESIIDDTPEGMANYLFKSFKTNVMREKQYARNKKEDLNYDQDNIPTAYENWYEQNNISAKEKLLSDLRKDFFTLRLAEIVEENFDAEHFYLWRLKVFMGYTYKDLAEKTKIPSVRNKVLEVMDFLRENVKKEYLEKEFNDKFEVLIDFG